MDHNQELHVDDESSRLWRIGLAGKPLLFECGALAGKAEWFHA